MKKPVVDVKKDVVKINCDEDGSPLEIAVIPLRAPADRTLGVAVDLGWIRQLHYLQYWGKDLNNWRQRYHASRGAGMREVESLSMWPIVELGHANAKVLETLFSGLRDGTLQRETPHLVALADLQDGLQFEEGIETSIMQYPEVLSLIDGVTFRFPEAYFIGDMDVIVEGGTISRDPDWFRTFEGLPTRWRGRNCELCGSNNARVRHIIGPSRFVVCCACGLEYDNPQAIVVEAALDKYASDIHDTRKSAKSLVRAEQGADIFVQGLTALAPASLKHPVLDIGCASGELVYMLREKYNWPNGCLWGLEPSSHSARIAKERYNLNVLNCYTLDANFRKESFTTILIVNTIEHLPNPRAVLAHAYELLIPGGLLFIGTVPNVGSLASACFPEGFIAKNFPDGQHYYQYTPETLSDMCQRVGFSVVRTDGETRDSVLDKVRETACWLAFSCGVPLELCSREQDMLLAVKQSFSNLNEALTKQGKQEQILLVSEDDFLNADSFIEFWKREVWNSPYLSDEFDLWLKKPVQ